MARRRLPAAAHRHQPFPIQFRDPDLIGDIVCVVEEFALTPTTSAEITETAPHAGR